MAEALHFAVPPDHPSLAGHFPGKPIVPGVALLDRAIEILLRERPGYRLVRLDEVKFLQPVLPGDEVTIEPVTAAPDRLVFTATVGGRPAFRCRAVLSAAP